MKNYLQKRNNGYDLFDAFDDFFRPVFYDEGRDLRTNIKENENGYELEVEMPDNEMAQRRIGFYQRQGFALWNYPYLQPPYRQGDDFLPMYLMVYGNLQCEKDVEQVKDCIYREVYGIEQPVHQ